MSVFEQIRSGIRRTGLNSINRLALSIAKRWPYPVPITVDGRSFYVDLRSSIGRGIFVKHAFDPVVQDAITLNLSPGDTFIDVGANIGWYSFLSAGVVGASGHVHAFEFDARPLRAIRKTLITNPDLPITLHEIGLSDSPGKFAILMSKESGHTRIDPCGKGDDVVAVRTLDNLDQEGLFDRIDLLKVDVEGADLLVLKGARQVIEKYRPKIICEVTEDGLNEFRCSVNDVHDFLETSGYTHTYLQDVWTPTIFATPVSDSVLIPQ